MGWRLTEFDAVRGSGRGERTYWHRVVPALGVLFLLGALGKSIDTFARSGVVLEATLDLVLIGAPGAVLLVVGLWLPTTDVRPEFYPRIATWVAGGISMMAIVLGLRVLHPGVTVDFTFGTQAVFLAIGTIAGLGIGVHEAQALDRAETLEARNAELTAAERRLEDLVTQLEDSNQQLEASNERLEQFAYAASHDLREPLRMVRSYLRLVEQRYGDDLDADGREFVAFAVDGADRMDAMIDNLLEYSRVESQGEPFEVVDLDAVLDDVRTDLQFRMDETDTTLTRESLPTVEGDERQLRQVFQNLLTNAIKYSGDEPPRIHVSAAHENSAWKIAVHDEGAGIDPDDADSVFDVFQRLHSAEEQSGSGIGLALCKRIVERHGGTIHVDSEPGVGSTFWFTLPPCPDRAGAPAPVPPVEESGANTAARGTQRDVGVPTPVGASEE